MMYISEIIDGKVVQTEVQNISFDKRTDVLISGLGSAGSLAAVFAAENGLSVLGVEAYTCIGGTNTAGGVSWHYFGCPGGRYMEKDANVNNLFDRSHTFSETFDIHLSAEFVQKFLSLVSIVFLSE
ncbi:MAG: FAD-dependent oxidoreductase, partial [Clostridia bacterium]|nr:FAD-dependent oxidoreductase [Clostridia bacterium]